MIITDILTRCCTDGNQSLTDILRFIANNWETEGNKLELAIGEVLQERVSDMRNEIKAELEQKIIKNLFK